MTIEERLQTLERELAMTKAMLSHLLKESSAPEIRARRIILADDNMCHAELRMDDLGVVLALCSEEGDEVRIELRVGMEGAPILVLTDKGRTFVRLGEQWEAPSGIGLTVYDKAREFHWPPLTE
jgi:hypothetical protein